MKGVLCGLCVVVVAVAALRIVAVVDLSFQEIVVEALDFGSLNVDDVAVVAAVVVAV